MKKQKWLSQSEAKALGFELKENEKNRSKARYSLNSNQWNKILESRNSGYRSINHNQAVGGSKNSQHLYGKASDMVVKGYSPKQVFNEIEKLINRGEMLQGGLSAYSTFVHYDIRKVKARW